MKDPEVLIVGLNDRRRNQILMHNRHAPNWQATLALELVRTCALTAIDDGETSTGQSKVRVLTPTEVVDRACAIADLFYVELERRNWLLDYPSYDDLEKTETVERQPGFKS